MQEQEKYKKVLKKVIDETESYKIQSSEELIKKLVQELSTGTSSIPKKKSSFQTN